ncbi:hypothetical protein PspLS_02854 [Pyricularia sp. CBS 133598]|nr:hypothetical protein PspLS_02854 [Pyricularia sp. CBS 133598]
MPRRTQLSEAAKTIRQNWRMALSFSPTKQTRDGKMVCCGKNSCHSDAPGLDACRFSSAKCTSSAINLSSNVATISSLQRTIFQTWLARFYSFFSSEAEARAARANMTNRPETLSSQSRSVQPQFSPQGEGSKDHPSATTITTSSTQPTEFPCAASP